MTRLFQLGQASAVEGYGELPAERLEENQVRGLEHEEILISSEKDRPQGRSASSKWHGVGGFFGSVLESARTLARFPGGHRESQEVLVFVGELDGLDSRLIPGAEASTGKPVRERQRTVVLSGKDADPAGLESRVEALCYRLAQAVEVMVEGDGVDRVPEQDHVAIILGLIAGEDAAQAVESPRFIQAGALLPIDHAAAAKALGCVERLIGPAHQLERRHTGRIFLCEHPNSDTESESHGAVQKGPLAQDFEHLAGDLSSGGQVGFGENGRKNNAAVSRNRIRAAQGGSESLADFPDDRIAGFTSESLVDRCELVGIDQQK